MLADYSGSIIALASTASNIEYLGKDELKLQTINGCCEVANTMGGENPFLQNRTQWHCNNYFNRMFSINQIALQAPPLYSVSGKIPTYNPENYWNYIVPSHHKSITTGELPTVGFGGGGAWLATSVLLIITCGFIANTNTYIHIIMVGTDFPVVGNILLFSNYVNSFHKLERPWRRFERLPMDGFKIDFLNMNFEN